MPEPDLEKIIAFETSRDLCDWLRLNHSTRDELWVKIYKKNSGIASVTWDDVVIESLCWGWIDGIKKSLDDQAYLQRITPRKARSNWSKRNTGHVERLIKEGRMKPSGMAHVIAAKEDGRWEKAYSVSDVDIPEDFSSALDMLPASKHFFESLPKYSLRIIAHGLNSAKRPDTRQKRFKTFMDMLARQEKPK